MTKIAKGYLFSKQFCPHCDAKNWFHISERHDNVNAGKCWNCAEKFWMEGADEIDSDFRPFLIGGYDSEKSFDDNLDVVDFEVGLSKDEL